MQEKESQISEKQPFYLTRNESFGAALPADDYLHRAVNATVSDDDFSFNCTALDDHRLMPEWHSQFAVPEEKLLSGGWIYRDGEVNVITRCLKRTTRDPQSLLPTQIEMDITDSKRRDYHMTGKVLAASDWLVQPMLRWASVSIHWECEGRSAFGEAQEAQWGDFTRAFKR